MNEVLNRASGVDFEKVDKKIYVASDYSNAICRIDLADKGTELLFISRYDPYCRYYCWGKSARIDNKVLFVPCSGQRFCILDIETETVKDITPKSFEERIDDKDAYKFWQTAAYGRYYYVMGFRYPGFIKINADTYEFSYFDLYDENIEKNWKEDSYYFGDGVVNSGCKYYFAMGTDSGLLELDCEHDSYKMLHADGNIRRIQSISGNGNEIWMTDTDAESRKIVVWDMATGNSEIIRMPENGVWFAPVFHGQTAYLFPMSDKSGAYKIDIRSKSCSSFNEMNVILKGKNEDDPADAGVLGVREIGDNIILTRRKSHSWINYNLAKDEISHNAYEIKDKDYLDLFFKEYYDWLFGTIKESCSINENKMPLTEFLNRI